MNSEKLSTYLWSEIIDHVNRFFLSDVTDSFSGDKAKFLPYQEAINTRGNVIVIPDDIVSPSIPEPGPSIRFGSSWIKLYNPIPPPAGDGWQLFPNESEPIWYRHQSGTMIPIWNLYRNLLDLLTLKEERDSVQRDSHGRFLAEYSTRAEAGLLEVPHFNDSVALLAGAAGFLDGYEERINDLTSLVKPPVIVLSHDCDVLVGNDFWTQAIRAYRVLAPMRKLRWPAVSNIWWIVRNAFLSRSFYFDNIIGMIELERIYGYRSSFYLINGTRGRFGARSGEDQLREVISILAPPMEMGIHYNYDTHLDGDLLSVQISALEALMDRPIVSGRAHYLRFDPARSYQIWEKVGILIDESLGFTDRIGYRSGIGGCFRPLDPQSDQAMNLIEVPLVVMDKVLVDQYRDHAIEVFSGMIAHLKNVGGALSMIFHPGQFFNPEHRQMLGVYNQLLSECHRHGAVSETAQSLTRR